MKLKWHFVSCKELFKKRKEEKKRKKLGLEL
jgi:hypothetical protein